jgi:hypothetical protein
MGPLLLAAPPNFRPRRRGLRAGARRPPEIEGRAAPQIETGMMPMAGEDAILDAAAMERKPMCRRRLRKHHIAASATMSTAP